MAFLVMNSLKKNLNAIVVPPHFRISDWGARLYGQYSTDLRLIFVNLFSFIRPAYLYSGARTKKGNTEIIAAENQQIFVFLIA